MATFLDHDLGGMTGMHPDTKPRATSMRYAPRPVTLPLSNGEMGVSWFLGRFSWNVDRSVQSSTMALFRSLISYMETSSVWVDIRATLILTAQ